MAWCSDYEAVHFLLINLCFVYNYTHFIQSVSIRETKDGGANVHRVFTPENCSLFYFKRKIFTDISRLLKTETRNLSERKI